MLKRVTWFVGGAVAGLTGVGYTKRKVRATAAQLAPANVAKIAAAKARDRGQIVVEALREGRQAMLAREAELRAKMRSETEPRDEPVLDELVDMESMAVEPGQVVVVRQVRDDHVGPRRTSRRSHR